MGACLTLIHSCLDGCFAESVPSPSYLVLPSLLARYEFYGYSETVMATFLLQEMNDFNEQVNRLKAQLNESNPASLPSTLKSG